MARQSVTIKVAGLSELGTNLQKFAKEVKKTVLRSAARKAANEVRDTAKRLAIAQGLVKSGNMVKAIAARRMSRASSEGKEFMAVGVFKIPGGTYANTRHNVRKQRVGKEYEVDPPEFYWKFHELGAPGAGIPPRPFLVPAFETRKQGSPGVMATELDAGMQRATRKLAKAQRKGKG